MSSYNIITSNSFWSNLLNIKNPLSDGPNLPPISIFSKKRGITPAPTTTPIPTYSTNVLNDGVVIAPDLLMSDLEGLKSKFQPLLNNYKKYYTYIYIDNNRIDSNINSYNQSKQNLESYFQSLDDYLNKIQTNVNNINSKVYVLNENIREDKTKSGNANDALVDVTNKYIGTSEMNSDYIKKYNEIYLSTFTIGIITVLLGGTLVKVYGRIL